MNRGRRGDRKGRMKEREGESLGEKGGGGKDVKGRGG